MASKRQKAIDACIVRELKGKRMPRKKYERCVLRVKCANRIDHRPKRSNPYAICHASVG